MKYEIIDGKVNTHALEYHIVDHCNLHCDQCCSFSPYLKSWFVDPSQFERDLNLVKQYVRPTLLKIVGGEPLLHPELTTLLKMAKESGVAPQVSITTNGHLLPKMPPEFWKNIGLMTVSVYPQPALPNGTLRTIRKMASAHGISVNWKVQDKFVQMNRSTRSDYETAKETFQGCWVHHRCHNVKDGRFYHCTRPQYIQRFAPNPDSYKEDGVDLINNDKSALPMLIRDYLSSSEPINSCYLCLGAQAKTGIHRQLDARERKSHRQELTALCEDKG